MSEEKQKKLKKDTEAAIAASLISGAILKAGEYFAEWSAKRINNYLKNRREKRILAGAISGFQERYSTTRGYSFRQDLIEKPTGIERHINRRKYAFGFLFGDIIKNSDTVHYERKKE